MSPFESVKEETATQAEEQQQAEILQDASAQPPAPGDLLDHELDSLLARHKEWIESQGSSGQKLELSDLNFEGKDLAGVNLRTAVLHKANFRNAEILLGDFRGADLAQADFREANLLGADFQGANLQGARFGASSGLAVRKLARANLLGAELPESLLKFDGLQVADEAYRRARLLFWSMAGLTAISSGVAVFASDVQLLRNLPVPFMGSAIPMVGFFFTAPILLLFLYVFFHLAAHRLNELLGELPAVFPDGRLIEQAGQWEQLGFLTGQVHGDVNERRKLAPLERLISRIFSDWMVPAALLLFWARYLVLQQMRATLLHIFLFGAATAVVVYIRRDPQRPRLFEDPKTSPLSRWLPGIEKALVPVKIAGIIAIAPLFLSMGVIYGVPHDIHRGPDFSSMSPRRWAPSAFWLFGYDPFAHLAEANVTTRPKNWSGRDQDVPSVRGPNLNKSSLRYAEAYRSFWVNAHLWQADLEGASLSEADMRGAILREADLRSARLDRTALGGADLQNANLMRADLSRANVHNADLSFAVLYEAKMTDARLDGVNFFSADLRGANLAQANLENADLRETHLDGAELSHADLQAAYLISASLAGAELQDAQLGRAILLDANLQKADLRGALFQSTIVRDAIFTGAYLDGADLRGAVGLTPAQVCAASHHGVLLDDSLIPLVVAQCGPIQ